MPEAIGVAILTAVAADTVVVGAGTLASASLFGVSVASVVGTAAISGAMLGAQALIQATAATQKQTTTLQQGLPPRIGVYGRTMVGGTRCFMDSRNGNLYQILLLASHEIDGIEQYYIGDIGVAVVNGLVQSPPYGRSGGSSYVVFEPGAGRDDQAASGLILANFGELGPGFRQAGIARVAIIMAGASKDNFPKIYPNGIGTQFRFVIRGKKLYNPLDSAMDPENKAAWLWSANAGRVILDYCRGRDGLKMPLSSIDLPSFTDFTALSDEAVPLKAGGSEPRYQINGTYSYDELPKTVLARLLACCDGQLVQRSGKLGIRGGRWTPPVAFIGTRNILSAEIAEGNGALSAYNRLTTSFSYGSAYFGITEIFPPRVDAASEAQVGTRPQTLVLPMVTSVGQAERLAKIKFAQDNPLFIARLRTDAAGFKAIDEPNLDLEFTPLGATAPLASGPCMITAHSLDSDQGQTDIGLAYLTGAPYAFDPATEEPDQPRTPQQIASYNTVDPPANAHAVIAGGIGTVSWDPPTRADVVAVAQYRVTGSGEAGWQPMTLAASGLSATTPPLQDGQAYDFAVAYTAMGATSPTITIAAVRAQVPPSPPTQLTATVSGSTVALRALTPQSVSFSAIEFRRGGVPIGPAIVCPPNSYQNATDAPGSGTWTYTAVARTQAGTASAASAPVTVTL